MASGLAGDFLPVESIVNLIEMRNPGTGLEAPIGSAKNPLEGLELSLSIAVLGITFPPATVRKRFCLPYTLVGLF